MGSADHGDTQPAGQRDRVDRLAAIHAQLTAAVEDLARSDAWRRMLTIAARLPTYSPSNVLLIAIQKPEATRVAGFAAWKSLGRHVRKGEKGIAILAPCLYRHEEDTAVETAAVSRAAQPDPQGQRQLSGFRVVYVFDLSQTEGEPLPDLTPEELSGAAPEHLWERLANLARADGFTVERGDCQHAYGYTRFDQRTIRIRDDVDEPPPKPWRHAL
jgi:antirestriction protein ArdC